MTEAQGTPLPPWERAVLAASLFAVDPPATGGIALRAYAGPVRDHWLDVLRKLLTEDAPFRRMPASIDDDRLIGGLDLGATLRVGRPVINQGLLAEADGGVVVATMAERLERTLAGRLVAVMDDGKVQLERDGLQALLPAKFGVVAVDEGVASDESPPPALLERLAFHVDLSAVAMTQTSDLLVTGADIVEARCRLQTDDIQLGDPVIEMLCQVAMALGVDSVRGPLLAARAAKASAALHGRSEVDQDDAALAAQLVLAPRATVLPMPPPDPEEQPEQEQPATDEAETEPEQKPDATPEEIGDLVLQSVRAAIPEHVLAGLRTGIQRSARMSGRSGASAKSARRGRPVGVRRGAPSARAKLHVVETLRAAAPWQRLRAGGRSERQPDSNTERSPRRVIVHSEDFRIRRLKQRAQTVAIFVVDASGSSAVQRLAEAKGAVELFLADCYVRRDEVALLAFRGEAVDLLLPPTRSLTRAKRCLAALPGGGATPLAHGLDGALELAQSVERRGQTPIVVVLTDGRANIARDGTANRERAQADAQKAATAMRVAGLTALVVDTSPRPRGQVQRLAEAMDADYLPLPHADAGVLSRAVQATAASSGQAVVV